MKTVRPLEPAVARAVVVDGSEIVWRFFGSPEWVVSAAERKVSDLPDHESGRYGIDYAEHCKGCREYHSPEAGCLIPDTEA